MAPDEPDQTTPSVEPTPPSPAVEAAPEQEPVVSAEAAAAPAVTEPPAEGEQPA